METEWMEFRRDDSCAGDRVRHTRGLGEQLGADDGSTQGARPAPNPLRLHAGNRAYPLAESLFFRQYPASLRRWGGQYRGRAVVPAQACDQEAFEPFLAVGELT
jgi:hypothetical protein